jgi:hypothetical protein
MPIQKQLSIFMANRPGLLARICGVLSEANVNIYALSVHDTVDNAVVRVILDDPMKGILLLEQEEFYITEQSVVVLPVNNSAGVMAKIAQSLGRADINIEYAYCTASTFQETGCVVIKTSEPDRTMECLKQFELGVR